MSTHATQANSNTEQTDDAVLAERNIELAFTFMHDVLDDPALLDEIPDGVTLVLIPADDPATAEANLAIATAEARRGRNVYIRHM
ncbi:MAG TPA: DUF5647 family protein [Thermomicrobiales bacterium]|nr:DUF5647 family protein [Thermomicrobiales bacterium]